MSVVMVLNVEGMPGFGFGYFAGGGEESWVSICGELKWQFCFILCGAVKRRYFVGGSQEEVL
jgi:hypothetical protein